MNNFAGLPPLIVTRDELTTILYPLTMGYKWGENTINDLWNTGAPMPNPTIPARKIVTPSKLASWLADVIEKQGHTLDAGAAAYVDLLKKSV